MEVGGGRQTCGAEIRVARIFAAKLGADFGGFGMVQSPALDTSQRVIEVSTLLVIIKRNRMTIHMAAEMEACAIVVTGEVVTFELQADMATLSIVIQRILLAVAISGKMASFVMVIKPNGRRFHGATDGEVL